MIIIIIIVIIIIILQNSIFKQWKDEISNGLVPHVTHITGISITWCTTIILISSEWDEGKWA